MDAFNAAKVFRKRAVTVEAFCLGTDIMPRWFLDATALGYVKVLGVQSMVSADIVTLEGIMHAQTGDWIIKGTQGELYHCKPNIFKELYEPLRS